MKKSIYAMIVACLFSIGYSNAQFTNDDVQFWVGEGSNEAVIVIDFLTEDQSSFAWGYRFDGVADAGDALEAINSADGNLNIDMGDFLNDIFYLDFLGAAGSPNYWGTWSGTSSDDWAMNSGLDVNLVDGDWFGCSYTDFDPAISPSAPIAAIEEELPFSADNVLYWVGEGSNEAVVVIDFHDGDNSSIAWGFKFNGTATGADALLALDESDEQLSLALGDFLNDIFYMDFAGVGGSPAYWGTYSGSSSEDWSSNIGITTELSDGSWFGCSYTDFNPEILPTEPIAAENNNYEPGPYAPAAGQVGSTAIASNDDSFSFWATTCDVTRGSIDISDNNAPDASYGQDSDAVGAADGLSVVSLGDGGTAVLTFSPAISNGSGADFAIFENAFGDTFLELAFVEVSSDGVNYTRFPSVSLVQSDEQVDSFGETDPTFINNFAGKYRANFGTPFDLEELSGTPGLDLNQITHVKIVDVVGSVDDNYGSYDSDGNIINDPFPTAFESGGFDLDAVGVINSYVGVEASYTIDFTIYPNPASEQIFINSYENSLVLIMDASGRILKSKSLNKGTNRVNISALPTGFYTVQVKSDHKVATKSLIVQ